MPRPCRKQISIEDTPYYYCCNRVVRRAFLCGDAYSGKNYNHHRSWVESLVFELYSVLHGFTIPWWWAWSHEGGSQLGSLI